ncbi:hypothetical protein ACFPM0_29240 [Pseudonocardia sulfidoxydans]|uniref:hypothetical protein n=1 Tax=Pseudonocardia sulfidoxydans TaxID=54011 RepID=UPI003608349B
MARRTEARCRAITLGETTGQASGRERCLGAGVTSCRCEPPARPVRKCDVDRWPRRQETVVDDPDGRCMTR